MKTHATTDIRILSGKSHYTLLTYIFTILKLFTLVVLGGGLIIGIFQSLRTRSFYGFVEGIVFGASLAIIALPLLILLDVIQKLKCYRKFKNIDFGVNQERKILVSKEYNSVFNGLINVLSEIKKIEIYRREIDSGVIEANTSRTWRSFGENIKVEFFKWSKGNATIVVITSKPSFSLTMIDFCKNFENVETIMRALRIKGIQQK